MRPGSARTPPAESRSARPAPRQPRASDDREAQLPENATVTAATSSVRRVPIAGISTSAERNVPSRLPMSRARTAGRRPSPRPARRRSRVAPRKARPCRAGSPAARTARARRRTTRSLPPAETLSRPFTETSRNGPAAKGTIAIRRPRRARCGRGPRARVAVRHLSAEPVADGEEARTRPITFAQTIVEPP